MQIYQLTYTQEEIDTFISNLIDGTTPFTGIDINGGTVDGITSLTVANDVNIGAHKLTVGALTVGEDGLSIEGDWTWTSHWHGNYAFWQNDEKYILIGSITTIIVIQYFCSDT